MHMEKNPLGYTAEIAASGEQILGSISLVKPRTITITGRCTFNGSATGGARVKGYYSPNGRDFDTVAYFYFDIDLTAGSAVQESHNIDAPEEGLLRISVENLDTTYSVTGVFVWGPTSEYGRFA
jgi:hypothetical protein